MTAGAFSVSFVVEPSGCQPDDHLCRAVREATGNDWLAAGADWLIAKPLVVTTLIVAGFMLRWLIHKVISRVVGRAAGTERRRQRAETLASVLRSVASVVVFTLVTMMILSELGLDIGPLIASAGLVGVALGIGAQSLVRDFLSGLFMFFEDQCGVGDTVIIGDVTGVVEAISLRITRIRADDGTIWHLRNGEILKVGNISQRGTLPGEDGARLPAQASAEAPVEGSAKRPVEGPGAG